MIYRADPGNGYDAHPYVVDLPKWAFADNGATREILAWCTERWGARACTPYQSEACRTAAWMHGIITLRFRTYADAFEFQMRWSG